MCTSQIRIKVNNHLQSYDIICVLVKLNFTCCSLGSVAIKSAMSSYSPGSWGEPYASEKWQSVTGLSQSENKWNLPVHLIKMPKSDMHCPTQGRRERRKGRHTRGDLSHDDLLFLLSILEGELQVTHCKHIHVLFQLINSKRAIKHTVTVATAILRCRRNKKTQMFYCYVCHTRPEMRWSLCWSQRRQIHFYLRPIMVSADWRKCSVLCTETRSGLSSCTWRTCTNNLLQRYKNPTIKTTKWRLELKCNLIRLRHYCEHLLLHGATATTHKRWQIRHEPIINPLKHHKQNI